jgi:NADH dehydrogenase
MELDSNRATQILIIGGGFGGVFAARNLEKIFPPEGQVKITLVSRDNFFLMTPLLFEAMSGTIELGHCSVPIRDFLRHTFFIEASVTHMDLENRTVFAQADEGEVYSLKYDQLVLAMGAETNRNFIPGSEHAFTFKTLGDAMLVRNHIIERFERADVEKDSNHRRMLLTFVVIGGGLVGVEVFGELTAFVSNILSYYRQIRPNELRFYLVHSTDHILPEVDVKLGEWVTRELSARPGASIRTCSPVQRIESGRVFLPHEELHAGTIILAAGIVPSPSVAKFPLQKTKHGQIEATNTLQAEGHPDIWVLGDCAAVPSPDGGYYPFLAQHAIRAAKCLALNMRAALNGKRPRPFTYDTIGVMGSLGNFQGFGKVFGVRLHGFIAWWLRRTYYLSVMPRWSRRLQIVVDWTLSLFFRRDIVKVDLIHPSALKASTPPKVGENQSISFVADLKDPFGGKNMQTMKATD